MEYIREQIMTEGYLLEMEIAATLRRRRYDVHKSAYYFDADENIGRELDMLADPDLLQLPPVLVDRDDFWHISPRLLVECKKTRAYYSVFYRSEPVVGHFDIGHSIDVTTARLGYGESACYQILAGAGNLHYLRSGLHMVSEHQQIPCKDQSGKSKAKNLIFDSIMKIVKYMNYEFLRLRPFFREKSARKDIVFFFPVIVFDGELYEVSYKRNLSIEPVRRLIYETNYSSNLTTGLVPSYIDIVRKDAIESCLDDIERDVRRLNEYMEKPDVQTQLDGMVSYQHRRRAGVH
jgi:hypothetical protein